jgi:hypothetical protein
MAEGWGKVKSAAEYAGMSPRTVSDWLKAGLKHSRLPSGAVLIRFSDIDEYLERFTVDENMVDQMVDEITKDLK